MSRIIVFDVNETLLDLAALDPLFERMFGDAAARRAWFGQVLRSAMTVTLTERYHDFSDIGTAALTMLAQSRGVTIAEADRRAVGDTMRRLPPHPEVPEALKRLQEAGLRLAALTNSAPAVMREQLANAGLGEFLSDLMSVEGARLFKPALGVYRHAASELGVATADMRLVAAHGWDLAGAMSAGCATAFVARPGQVTEPLFERPEIIGADMTEVATRIIEIET